MNRSYVYGYLFQLGKRYAEHGDVPEETIENVYKRMVKEPKVAWEDFSISLSSLPIDLITRNMYNMAIRDVLYKLDLTSKNINDPVDQYSFMQGAIDSAKYIRTIELEELSEADRLINDGQVELTDIARQVHISRSTITKYKADYRLLSKARYETIIRLAKIYNDHKLKGATMMKRVEFEDDDDKINVYLDGENVGYLEFDPEQDAWVYWFTSIFGDDGTTYFKDLNETKDEVIGDLEERMVDAENEKF